MLKSVFSLNSQKKVLSHRINSVVSSINEASLYVSVDDLTKVLLFFKNDENCLYKVLVDIFVVDFFESQKRFEIIKLRQIVPGWHVRGLEDSGHFTATCAGAGSISMLRK